MNLFSKTGINTDNINFCESYYSKNANKNNNDDIISSMDLSDNNTIKKYSGFGRGDKNNISDGNIHSENEYYSNDNLYNSVKKFYDNLSNKNKEGIENIENSYFEYLNKNEYNGHNYDNFPVEEYISNIKKKDMPDFKQYLNKYINNAMKNDEEQIRIKKEKIYENIPIRNNDYMENDYLKNLNENNINDDILKYNSLINSSNFLESFNDAEYRNDYDNFDLFGINKTQMPLNNMHLFENEKDGEMYIEEDYEELERETKPKRGRRRRNTKPTKSKSRTSQSFIDDQTAEESWKKSISNESKFVEDEESVTKRKSILEDTRENYMHNEDNEDLEYNEKNYYYKKYLINNIFSNISKIVSNNNREEIYEENDDGIANLIASKNMNRNNEEALEAFSSHQNLNVLQNFENSYKQNVGSRNARYNKNYYAVKEENNADSNSSNNGNNIRDNYNNYINYNDSYNNASKNPMREISKKFSDDNKNEYNNIKNYYEYKKCFDKINENHCVDSDANNIKKSNYLHAPSITTSISKTRTNTNNTTNDDLNNNISNEDILNGKHCYNKHEKDLSSYICDKHINSNDINNFRNNNHYLNIRTNSNEMIGNKEDVENYYSMMQHISKKDNQYASDSDDNCNNLPKNIQINSFYDKLNHDNNARNIINNKPEHFYNYMFRNSSSNINNLDNLNSDTDINGIIKDSNMDSTIENNANNNLNNKFSNNYFLRTNMRNTNGQNNTCNYPHHEIQSADKNIINSNQICDAHYNIFNNYSKTHNCDINMKHCNGPNEKIYSFRRGDDEITKKNKPSLYKMWEEEEEEPQQGEDEMGEEHENGTDHYNDMHISSRYNKCIHNSSMHSRKLSHMNGGSLPFPFLKYENMNSKIMGSKSISIPNVHNMNNAHKHHRYSINNQNSENIYPNYSDNNNISSNFSNDEKSCEKKKNENNILQNMGMHILKNNGINIEDDSGDNISSNNFEDNYPNEGGENNLIKNRLGTHSKDNYIDKKLQLILEEKKTNRDIENQLISIPSNNIYNIRNKKNEGIYDYYMNNSDNEKKNFKNTIENYNYSNEIAKARAFESIPSGVALPLPNGWINRQKLSVTKKIEIVKKNENNNDRKVIRNLSNIVPNKYFEYFNNSFLQKNNNFCLHHLKLLNLNKLNENKKLKEQNLLNINNNINNNYNSIGSHINKNICENKRNTLDNRRNNIKNISSDDNNDESQSINLKKNINKINSDKYYNFLASFKRPEYVCDKHKMMLENLNKNAFNKHELNMPAEIDRYNHTDEYIMNENKINNLESEEKLMPNIRNKEYFYNYDLSNEEDEQNEYENDIDDSYIGGMRKRNKNEHFQDHNLFNRTFVLPKRKIIHSDLVHHFNKNKLEEMHEENNKYYMYNKYNLNKNRGRKKSISPVANNYNCNIKNEYDENNIKPIAENDDKIGNTANNNNENIKIENNNKYHDDYYNTDDNEEEEYNDSSLCNQNELKKISQIENIISRKMRSKKNTDPNNRMNEPYDDDDDDDDESELYNNIEFDRIKIDNILAGTINLEDKNENLINNILELERRKYTINCIIDKLRKDNKTESMIDSKRELKNKINPSIYELYSDKYNYNIYNTKMCVNYFLDEKMHSPENKEFIQKFFVEKTTKNVYFVQVFKNKNKNRKNNKDSSRVSAKVDNNSEIHNDNFENKNMTINQVYNEEKTPVLQHSNKIFEENYNTFVKNKLHEKSFSTFPSNTCSEDTKNPSVDFSEMMDKNDNDEKQDENDINSGIEDNHTDQEKVKEDVRNEHKINENNNTPSRREYFNYQLGLIIDKFYKFNKNNREVDKKETEEDEKKKTPRNENDQTFFDEYKMYIEQNKQIEKDEVSYLEIKDPQKIQMDRDRYNIEGEKTENKNILNQETIVRNLGETNEFEMIQTSKQKKDDESYEKNNFSLEEKLNINPKIGELDELDEIDEIEDNREYKRELNDDHIEIEKNKLKDLSIQPNLYGIIKNETNYMLFEDEGVDDDDDDDDDDDEEEEEEEEEEDDDDEEEEEDDEEEEENNTIIEEMNNIEEYNKINDNDQTKKNSIEQEHSLKTENNTDYDKYSTSIIDEKNIIEETMKTGINKQNIQFCDRNNIFFKKEDNITERREDNGELKSNTDINIGNLEKDKGKMEEFVNHFQENQNKMMSDLKIKTENAFEYSENSSMSYKDKHYNNEYAHNFDNFEKTHELNTYRNETSLVNYKNEENNDIKNTQNYNNNNNAENCNLKGNANICHNNNHIDVNQNNKVNHENKNLELDIKNLLNNDNNLFKSINGKNIFIKDMVNENSQYAHDYCDIEDNVKYKMLDQSKKDKIEIIKTKIRKNKKLTKDDFKLLSEVLHHKFLLNEISAIGNYKVKYKDSYGILELEEYKLQKETQGMTCDCLSIGLTTYEKEFLHEFQLFMPDVNIMDDKNILYILRHSKDEQKCVFMPFLEENKTAL